MPSSDSLAPRTFSTANPNPTDPYLADSAVVKLIEFFEAKGLAAIKDEDRREEWYADWLAYQAKHHLYADLLTPKKFNAAGTGLDLLRLTRFLEVFAYFSPAHGYSMQVTFLGLFPILMSSNAALQEEAIASLRAGGMMALGVSEKDHGADLFGNELTLTPDGLGQYIASGSKYYIGNANVAWIITTLARQRSAQEGGEMAEDVPEKRVPFALFALRPQSSTGFIPARKIRTIGVRAAFVGEFDIRNHPVPEADIISEGRKAWDGVFGTIMLGKFFLGFGSIGICQHALAESIAHLRSRILYGKPALEMPHLRTAASLAYARLLGMKLYAYRALDYLRSAIATDRRYLLIAAVQKAKVSTEGVKVIALLMECLGAKAMVSDTFIEMALRDAQLIPAVEGSTHVNLGLTAQFLNRYFWRPRRNLAPPPSMTAGEISGENPYLFEAKSGATGAVPFAPFLRAYVPFRHIPNVRIFARQAHAFRGLLHARRIRKAPAADLEMTLMLGQLLATIAYGQLIAESAARQNLGGEMVAAIFHPLILDLSAIALQFESLPQLESSDRLLIHRLIAVPQTRREDWDVIGACLR